MKRNFLFPMITASIVLTSGLFSVNAQENDPEIETEASYGEYLDLEAVASVFGDAEYLEDFEYKLNDPKMKISNLDLNEDGEVDYLRVMETTEGEAHLVAIQAVLAEDEYQDVATIEVEKDEAGEEHVQVVGDVYLYGPNYIVEPVYVYRPPLFSIFWAVTYRPYRSVFYWGYYPRFYRPWRPFPLHRYHTHVHVHINKRHTYLRPRVRYSTRAVTLHRNVSRRDYAVKYPGRSHSARVVRVNKADGTKKRAVGVNQADGDKYRAAGVNKPDGTKRRAAGVNKADGTKKRAVGVNQADGDKYRAAGVNKPDGTKKRVAGVNKADGTKKRVASVEKPDGSRKTVAVKKNPNGSRRAVSVNKKADGSRTVKTARKKGKRKKTVRKSRKRKTRG